MDRSNKKMGHAIRLLAAVTVGLLIGRWATSSSKAVAVISAEFTLTQDGLSVELTGVPRNTELVLRSRALTESIVPVSVALHRDGTNWRWSGGEDDVLRYVVPSNRVLERSAGLHRVGGGVVFQPRDVLPMYSVKSSVRDLRTIVECVRDGARRISWPSHSHFLFSGGAQSLHRGSTSIVVSTHAASSRFAGELASNHAKLTESIAGTQDPPTTKAVLVVAPEREFRGPELRGVLSAHRSNLFLAPWAADSPMVARRLARHVVEQCVGPSCSPISQAKQVALADWCVVLARKDGSMYAQTWAQDAALRTLGDLGLADALDPTRLSDQHYPSRERAIVYLLAGLVWHQLLREFRPGQRTTELDIGGAWAHLNSREIQLDREAVMSWLGPRIREASVAETRVSTSRATGLKTPDVLAWGGFDGVIEECGCIAARARGGVLRLSDELRRRVGAGGLRICLGNMFASPRSPAAGTASSVTLA